MATLLTPIPIRITDGNGIPQPFAKLYTWVAGTPSTALAAFTDASEAVPLSNPVIADAGGLLPQLWLGSSAYKFEARKADGVSFLWQSDTIQIVTQLALGTAYVDQFTGTGSQTAFSLSQNPGNQANLDVALGGVTQRNGVDFTWASGNVVTFTTAPPNGVTVQVRYTNAISLGASDAGNVNFVQAGTGAVFRTMQDKARDLFHARDFGVVADGATDVSAALQAAMDAATITSPTVDLAGPNGLSHPLRITTSTVEGIRLAGNGRVETLLQPLAVSLATAPANLNAIIVNQSNNPHLTLERVRFWTALAYTGVAIHCLEGGGSDHLGQCLFSATLRDIWCDLASTNSGFLVGATQNSVFDTMTFENMKGIFNLQGVGSGDNFYRNISMSSCYDQFILQTADTNGSFAMSVDGLHAYQHLRGRLFDVQNWYGGNSLANITYEVDAANLGTTGLFKFKDCIGPTTTNFTALARSGVPACATGIELDTHTGKFANGAINADIGCKLTGTGISVVDFQNVDFTTCTTACLQFAAAIAAGSVLRTRGCRFNNSQSHCVTSVANAMSWHSTDDEFLNAGLVGGGTGASSRNLLLNSSGQIVFTRPRIGRDNGSAAAIYFIEATGSGTVDIYDPIWVGTPPTARITGSQTVNIHLTHPTNATTVTAATYTVLDSDRDVIANRAGTVTLTLPAAASYPGRRLSTRTIQAQTVVSASSNVVPSAGGAAGTAILAATAGKWAELVSDGTSWQVQLAN
jgi:hypothetical protein